MPQDELVAEPKLEHGGAVDRAIGDAKSEVIYSTPQAPPPSPVTSEVKKPSTTVAAIPKNESVAAVPRKKRAAKKNR